MICGTTAAAAWLNCSSDDPNTDVRAGNAEVAAGPVVVNTDGRLAAATTERNTRADDKTRTGVIADSDSEGEGEEITEPPGVRAQAQRRGS